MDMWVSHAMRKRGCVLCTQPITPGNEVMVGQWKRRFPWGMRTKRTMSHLQCWYDKARTWLQDHPYEPVIKAGPGRPKRYTPEQISARRNLQNNIKRWTLKQQEYIGIGLWTTADRYKDRVAGARDKLVKMGN